MGMKKANTELSRKMADECSIFSLRVRHERQLIQQGNCYYDALHVAANLGDRAYYCEGWAKSPFGIFVEHAWVWYEGEVVDATWENDDLGEAEYCAVLCLSVRRLVTSGGYTPPVSLHRRALKLLGISEVVSQIYVDKVFELYHLNKGDGNV